MKTKFQVFGHKDPEGFYRGEINKRVGYIPYNLVRPMSKEEAADYIARTGTTGFVTAVPSTPYDQMPEFSYRGIPRRAYYMSDSYRYWPHTNSDPSLVSTRPLTVVSQKPAYPAGAYGGFRSEEVHHPARPAVHTNFGSSPAIHDIRARRSKWKQKSHSLDCYDGTDRDEYSSHTSDPPPMGDQYEARRQHYYPPAISDYPRNPDYRYGSIDRAHAPRRRDVSAPGRSPSEHTLPNTGIFYTDRGIYDQERYSRSLRDDTRAIRDDLPPPREDSRVIRDELEPEGRAHYADKSYDRDGRHYDREKPPRSAERRTVDRFYPDEARTDRFEDGKVRRRPPDVPNPGDRSDR